MSIGVILIISCSLFLAGLGLLARYILDNEEKLLKWANSENHDDS